MSGSLSSKLEAGHLKRRQRTLFFCTCLLPQSLISVRLFDGHEAAKELAQGAALAAVGGAATPDEKADSIEDMHVNDLKAQA